MSHAYLLAISCHFKGYPSNIEQDSEEISDGDRGAQGRESRCR
jgi:hypothetical protein